MNLFKFTSQTTPKAALSNQKDGSNLPIEGSPWLFQNEVKIDKSDKPRIGASNSEILCAIEAKGFMVLPEKSLV